MKSHRPYFFLFKNRFSKASSEVFPLNSQPRTPSRRQRIILGSVALLICALTPSCVHAGTLSVTPSSTSFGTVALGTKNSQSIQLKNSGSSSLTISSVTLVGLGFSMSDPYVPRTLAAGATATLTVYFAPLLPGGATATITLRSNASNPTVTVSLSGSGALAARTLSLSASSLSFGNEIVGDSSTLGIAVKNTGNSSVTISQVTVSGTGFGIAGGFIGTTIAAGQTATLNVVFAPTTTGSMTGKVTISSNATNSPNAVSAAGTGVSSTAHWVALSWYASSSSGVTGYYVYRSTISGSSYSRINSSPTSAMKFTDGSVAGGKTYYYVVTAVNSSGGESAHSGQITAVIP
jgi:Abnormal spindle-like microcephaly-assoc'd, ASPM-SPD-2-Hydin